MKKHIVMVFRFAGMRKAYEFENELRKLEVDASAVFECGAWAVKTNSRCLIHAHKLVKLLYAHEHVGVGYCVECGHYGSDCTGRTTA